MRRTSQPTGLCHGFELAAPRDLPELRCVLHRATHWATGLRVLSLQTADSENLFAAAFATPPNDDSGVAHILEHSVLGGSRRFPVKDPFLEMLKASMATFINAMTYADHTVYPVASNVRQDFFNLVEVYLDALFAPLLTPESLAQEGHHLEFETPGDPDTPLTVQGIVYNEMKGSFAELDTLIAREVTGALLPDTCYAFESGGRPEAIPTLAFDRFAEFYAMHYHPANARVFFYGDIPLHEKLAFLDQYLKDLPHRDRQPLPAFRAQPRWTRPRECRVPYPVAPDDEQEAKAAVTLTWLTGDIADPVHDVAMDVLDHVLLGDAAAPLRKALIDSQLGEGLASSGHDGDGFYRLFQVGLKGTAEKHAEAIVELVLDSLRACVRDGLPPKRIRAAFNQLECNRLDIGSEYPLQLMDDAFEPWLFDLDPATNLEAGHLFAQVEERYRDNPRFFEELLETALLGNPHRLTAVFVPTPGLLEQREQECAATLAARKAALSLPELEAVARDAQRLRALQGEPNRPEALALLPRLRRRDLPSAPREIPTDGIPLENGCLLLRNDLFTNGMFYLHLAFSLENVSSRTRRLAPLLGHLLTRLGTVGRPFTEIAEQISLVTGGISAGAHLIARLDGPDTFLPVFSVALQCREHALPEALDLLAEILTEIAFDDPRRVLDVVNQRKVHLRNAVLTSGHTLAALHAGRTISAAAELAEAWHGVPQLLAAGKLSASFTERFPALKDGLRAAVAEIFGAGVVAACFTGISADDRRVADWLQSRFPAGPRATAALAPDTAGARTGLREGLAATSDVAYCTRVLPAPPFTDPDAVPLQVFSRLLSYGHLWEEIRVKGGAYGGFCGYDSVSRTFALLSYRDPHIAETLAVFDAVPAFVSAACWSDDDVERALIGCAKHDERPIRPAGATAAALWRGLGGITPEFRRDRWRRLLGVTPAQVRAAAERLITQSFPHSNVCVLASESRLAEAGEPDSPFAITRVL